MKTRNVTLALGLGVMALSLANSNCGGSTGGTPGSGGSSSSGGSSTGGSSTGGSSTGGSSTGGSSTGGKGSGGAASGGTSTGGTSTGGTSTGGSSTGGASSGGAAGGSSSSGGAAGGAMAGRSGGGGRGAMAGGTGTTGSGGAGGSGSSGSFTLTSPSLMDNAKFDGKYTCNGGMLGAGVNPEIDWAGVPDGTKSFAITFLDTTLIDAKMDSLGNHWAIWNIPPTVTKLMEGLGMTLSGDLAMAKQSGKFLTPCAQSIMMNMDDKYEFTIYALPTDTLAITGTSVANARTALAAAKPLGTAVLHGHAGLKGK